MSTYIILGKYSNEGAGGLVEGNSDRRAAMEKLTNSVGAKLLDYYITRGVYDFCLITEADSFEMIAAINLKAKAAGAVKELETLESISINNIRGIAKNVEFSPPAR